MKVIVEETLWKSALRSFDDYDFYHTYEYHSLLTAGCGDEACLFLHEGANTIIAMPLLIRRGRIGGIDYVDATSVYGYPGPVIAGDRDSKAEVAAFQSSLGAALAERGIVSAFSRLHPMLLNDHVLHGLGHCDAVGKTVSIDLREPDEVQWRRYRSNHRRNIVKLQKQGVTGELSARPEDLAAFRELYAQTMDRLDAAASYRFSDEYFEKLMRAMEFDMHLFVCRQGSKVICGGLFSSCNGMIQYHLGGTDADYLRSAPSKLLFDSVRKWGNSNNMRSFHLGGGVGSEKDSLFRFKQGFSDIQHEFRVWKWVVDRNAYNSLTALHQGNDASMDSGPTDNDFFPAYRSPF
jgi:hypothetical protein